MRDRENSRQLGPGEKSRKIEFPDRCAGCGRKRKEAAGLVEDDYLAAYSLVQKALEKLEGKGDGIHPSYERRLEKVFDAHPGMEKNHRDARRALESILAALDGELDQFG